MKHFLFTALTALFITIMSQTACFYDNELDLYGAQTCDTTAVSYSLDIRPILDANCITCHAPGGEQEVAPLLTYEDVKKYTGDRNIVDRTSGTTVLMPPTGKMSDCNVSLIESWVNAGAPNN